MKRCLLASAFALALAGIAQACPQAPVAGRLFHRTVSRVRATVSACPTLERRVQRTVAVESVQACPTAVTRTVMKPVVTAVESTVMVPETKMIEKVIQVPVTTMVPKTVVTNKTTYVPHTETVMVDSTPAVSTRRMVERSRIIGNWR